MQTVANFDRIGEENALTVLARAGALAAQGMDVINLGIGQPDFPTPDNIVEAAVKALRGGQHGADDRSMHSLLPVKPSDKYLPPEARPIGVLGSAATYNETTVD